MANMVDRTKIDAPTTLNGVKKKPHLSGAFVRVVADYLPFVAYCIRVMPVNVPSVNVPALTRPP